MAESEWYRQSRIKYLRRVIEKITREQKPGWQNTVSYLEQRIARLESEIHEETGD